MEGRLKEQVRLQLAKAQEKLASAKALFQKGMYDDAISRSYYAMFHSAKALLQTKNLSAKSHSGVITLLSQHFIKEKILNIKFGKIISYAKELRESGDYDIIFKASPEEAEAILNDTTIFLEEIERQIKNT